MAIIKITNIDTLDPHNFELFSKYMANKGLEFTIEDDSVSNKKPISAPKKKSAPKSKAKSSDDFDREKYLATAKAMGCYGKKGVWKSCRQYVYAVMAGEFTVEQGADLVKQLKESKGWA